MALKRATSSSSGCSTPNCARPVYAKGMCQRCYMAARRSDPSRPRCSGENCEQVAVVKGLCDACYNKVRRAERNTRRQPDSSKPLPTPITPTPDNPNAVCEHCADRRATIGAFCSHCYAYLQSAEKEGWKPDPEKVLERAMLMMRCGLFVGLLK